LGTHRRKSLRIKCAQIVAGIVGAGLSFRTGITDPGYSAR
jgi:hypothetical protein